MRKISNLILMFGTDLALPKSGRSFLNIGSKEQGIEDLHIAVQKGDTETGKRLIELGVQ